MAKTWLDELGAYLCCLHDSRKPDAADFSRFSDEVTSYLAGIVRSNYHGVPAATVDEICDEARQEFFRKLLDYEKPETVRNWSSFIKRSLSNAVMDVLRDRAKTRQVFELAVTAYDRNILMDLKRKEDLEHLREVLATFPVRVRAMFHLFFWEGKSMSKIAEILGCSVANVSQQIEKYLIILKSRMEEKSDDVHIW